MIVGRMKRGVSVAAAQAELDVIVEQLKAADPERWGLGAVVTNMQEKITGRFRRSMLLLAGAAGLVMIIVCANLSNLLLARAEGRRKEIAVRGAMGASRVRLIRQMLTESLVLSLVGALLGVGVAYAIAKAVASSSAISVPLLSSATIDGAALAFSASLALAAGLIFGLAPALQSSAGREHAALTGGGRGASVGKRGAWVREALVVSEVALACVLLIGAVCSCEAFLRSRCRPRFSRGGGDGVARRYAREFESGQERVSYFHSIVESVAAVAGVDAVGFSDTLPLGRNRGWGIRVKGIEYPPEDCCPGALPRLWIPATFKPCASHWFRAATSSRPTPSTPSSSSSSIRRRRGPCFPKHATPSTAL